jgi:hypothetical protein
VQKIGWNQWVARRRERQRILFPIDNSSTGFDKFSRQSSSLSTRQNCNEGDPMGNRAGLTGGHLCIDLTNIEMSGEEQQDLLRAVQATVVAYLARHSAVSQVVTISMSPNNGQDPHPKPEPPPPPRA